MSIFIIFGNVFKHLLTQCNLFNSKLQNHRGYWIGHYTKYHSRPSFWNNLESQKNAMQAMNQRNVMLCQVIKCLFLCILIPYICKVILFLKSNYFFKVILFTLIYLFESKCKSLLNFPSFDIRSQCFMIDNQGNYG